MNNPKDMLVSEPALSKHELKLYGFAEQPLVGNERIKADAARYTEKDHPELKGHRSQSFKAGAWQIRTIYEPELTKLRAERNELGAALEWIVNNPEAHRGNMVLVAREALAKHKPE